MGSGGGSLLSRTLFGTLIVLGFILVISLGILQSEGDKTTTMKITITSDDCQPWRSMRKLQQQDEEVKVSGKGKSSVADLNYMSKRRVPNGPDPIHNRRAGNSGRPPGQA